MNGVSAPNPSMTELFQLDGAPNCTRTHRPSFASFALVDRHDLALASVSCPSLVPHYLQRTIVDILVNPSRRRRLRGAFWCKIDAAKFSPK